MELVNIDKHKSEKKAVFISCFDYYNIRVKNVIEYFHCAGYSCTYLISDFNHYTQSKYKVDYGNTIQLPVPMYFKNLSIRRLLSHFIFAKKVYKELNQIGPSVIYCMIPPNSLARYVIKYKKRHHTKVVFDVFDSWPESFPYGKFGGLLAFPFWIWRSIRNNNIIYADLLINVSKTTQDLMSFYAPKVPSAILLPMTDNREAPEYNHEVSNGISFCYLGSINHITDIDLIVDLLSRVNVLKKVTLHIIGKGCNLDSFVQTLERAGISVICHGTIFDSEGKNAVFSQCSFGLNLPRIEINSTMSLKSVDYLRAGLPFLNSGAGDTENMVRTRGVGINIDRANIDKSVQDIIGISNDHLRKMSDNCRDVYNEKFKNQDLHEMFRTIINA